ncbi:TolB-like 6-bladed beta-propeller domain-containing protein [Belliella sp. DSM 107340]|uniref:TolB-like 6-bladed beta-propeller domain-containing protein n=1 Tax=Belliella calami TaxID=2923436 RepID=A0ABS9UR04_9BACT|nr:BF3164 family lipoprotein [Belliella calami]MCH7399044.1 TolB-like 6-bladed beta-propeller domain-containing protein [Belliella calami]
MLLFISCEQDSFDRPFTIDKVENISTKIQDFDTEPLITYGGLSILGEYLIVMDMLSTAEKAIHIYNKNNFEYISSTGFLGEGPGEITRIGEFTQSYHSDRFWIPDFAKLKLFQFNLDSLLLDDKYKPSVSFPFGKGEFLSRLKFVDEQLAYGSWVEVLRPGEFRTSLGKWDLETGNIEKFGEEHPNLVGERTNAYFDYSYHHNIMVLSYTNYDILSVFDNHGKIKMNLIGEKKFDNENRKLKFFGQTTITDKYIITSYLGDYGFLLDKNQRPKGIQPNKLLFFSLEGELLKTLDTEHQIMTFTVDEENNRIFCFFSDREIPLGYFHYD